MGPYRFFRTFLVSTLLLISFIALTSCAKREHGSETDELNVRLSLENLGKQEKKAELTFEVAEGWHIYGPYPQKNGRPTSITFSLAKASFEESIWPQPKDFDEGENGVSQGYEGSFKVETKFQVDDSLSGPLIANINWVACREICVPGEAELKISLN